MALTKLGPNKWRIRVSVFDKHKGYPISKQDTFTGNKTEATIREGELLRQLKTRSLTPQTIKNFKEAVEQYKCNLRAEGKLSPSHERKIDYIANELGHISLDVLPDRFEEYRKNLLMTPTRGGRKRSGASLNRYTEIVRAVFNHLVALEKLGKNPITKRRFPKFEEKPRDRYLTQDERIRLFNAIEEHRPHILPIVRYMSLVPCRKTELTTAKREQYNPFTGTIYIPDSKADVPIYKPVPEEMKEYFNSIPSDCPWLFYWVDQQGGYRQFGTLQKPWEYCLKKAGLRNVRIHDLRHISATDLYEAGNPERVIMSVAGWKTPMLSNYRHKDGFRDAQAIQFKRAENQGEPPEAAAI